MSRGRRESPGKEECLAEPRLETCHRVTIQNCFLVSVVQIAGVEHRKAHVGLMTLRVGLIMMNVC